MSGVLLNMVWPAIYVTEEVSEFWYFVIATVIIETVVLKYLTKFSFQKSILYTTIGNLVSGLIGTYIMMWLMIVWHFIIDGLLPQATFDPINWVMTFILMCLGSICIEVFSVGLLFKLKRHLLWRPLAIGNVLTYIIIALSMTINSNTNKEDLIRETVTYLPNRQIVELKDSTTLKIMGAETYLNYYGDSLILNTTFEFSIEFIDQANSKRQLFFSSSDNRAFSINNGNARLFYDELSDEIEVHISLPVDTPVTWNSLPKKDTILFRRE